MSRWLIALALSVALAAPAIAFAADEKAALDGALRRAGDNRGQIEQALRDVPADRREGMVFLVANMPDRDLKALKAEFLLENLKLAYQARQQFPWGRELPDEVFFNDVLPYASLVEQREGWRKDLYERFAPLVKDCRTSGEAARKLNESIYKLVKVQYHPTRRPKPCQSPQESMEAGYASCTGLSILLIDACRALAIPAHAAGTPLWTVPKGDANGNHGGNHTWVEVWDRQWHHLGASEPSELDQAWFNGNASIADEKNPVNWIYASSFRKTPTAFPMVWDLRDPSVPAFNATAFYKPLCEVKFDLPRGERKLIIYLGDRVVAADAEGPATFKLPRGQKYTARLEGAGQKAEWEFEIAADEASKTSSGPRK